MKIKKTLLKLRSFIRTIFLTNKDFSIISNNCWGGYVYQYFGLEYKTPFIGLYIFGPDYIRLIKDFDYYMSKSLIEIDLSQSKYLSHINDKDRVKGYPVGLLGDLEIHFLHYKNFDVAFEKWNRRLSKINKNNIIYKLSHRDLVDDQICIEFMKVTNNKGILISNSCFGNRFNYFSLNNNSGDIINEFESFFKMYNITQILNKL
jgi:uncharacterized protein (DUF1919 family)